MKVILHIDRLRLQGVPPHERERVLQQFIDSVQQQLAEPGAVEQLMAAGHRERLQGHVPPHGGGLGERAGHALVQGLRR